MMPKGYVVKTLSQRFAEKVTPEPNTGCHLWTAALNNKGYGVLGIGGRGDGVMYAHRYALQQRLGRELSDGECALHRCDNPCCVNPAHLFVGTMADNTRDMVAKGRDRFNRKPRP